ncbi:MAG: PEP-CTERM sorting domain-containing protein [Akkermansia sp.]
MNKNNVLILATSSLLLAPALFAADTGGFNKEDWNIIPANDKTIIKIENGQIYTHTPVGDHGQTNSAKFEWKGDKFDFNVGDTVSMKFSIAGADTASIAVNLGGKDLAFKDKFNFIVDTAKDGDKAKTCWLTYNGQKTTAFNAADGNISFTFTKLSDTHVIINSSIGTHNFEPIEITDWNPNAVPGVQVSSSDTDPEKGNVVFTYFKHTPSGSIPEPTTATLSLLGLASLLLRRRRA